MLGVYCLQLRIDLPGKVTQKVFDQALVSLARDAPPVPGFRRSKGGINTHFLARDILYFRLLQVIELANNIVLLFLPGQLLDD
jgi:hypothetical protein